MLARCPACHTVFRVRTEQLRAHHGQVRCGNCLTPFDALDNLLEDAASPEPTPQPTPAAETPPDRSDRFFVLEDKAADSFSDQLDFALPDALVPQRAPVRETDEPRLEPAERTPPPPMFPRAATAEEPRAAAVPSGAQGDFEPASGLPPAEPETDWTRSEPAPETLLHFGARPDRTEPGIPSPAQVEKLVAPQESAAAPTEPLTDADDEFAAYAPPKPPSPARRGLVGLGIGLLSGVLAAQSLYLFRADIAREWPLLRPALVKACAALGCTIELPRIASLISVESSDLLSEPGKAGHFILNATIRNRAPHPLAYPHLELTLTDARERPIVRRVLAPRDWFPDADLEQGFAAGRDIAVTLPFAADGLGATGYRIYAFYP